MQAVYSLVRRLLLATTPLLAFGLTQATAGPEGASVIGGAATIQGQGGPAVIVNQSTSSAVINWNTFNIRANESVRFNQPSALSVALNRVTGGLGPSEIMGSLTANGRVFIINRDGILFGPGSVVNTAGFLATTNDIKNADFMAGRYNFNIPGRPDASIVNQGRITATSGGFAALVAPGVRNSGTITATLGTVALASGNSFTLDMYGDKLITLAVGDSIASKVIDVATGRPLKSLVSNTKNGVISANGGRVELTAAAARAVVDSVINTKGVIRADSIGRHNGMIVLNAATGGSKPAGAPAQTIKLAGTISAAGRHRGTTGGTIVVSGEHIKVANARIDASGRGGGGKILIGGDWGGGHPDLSLITNASAKLENFTIATATTVSVDANSTINASATGRGHGGKVVLWSDNQTTFAGTIIAKGGAQAGDGGFAETSGRETLIFSGVTDLSAPHGRQGNLLLDPQDIVIDAAAAAGISASLANSDVTVLTSLHAEGIGNIEVAPGAIVTWSTPTTLTLSAYHDISFLQGSKVANTGAGNLILNADNTGTGSGTVNFLPARIECVGNCGTPTTPNDPRTPTIPEDPREHLPPQEGSGGGTIVILPSSLVDFSGSTGTVSIFYDPPGGTTKYQNPTNYLCSGSCANGGVLTQQARLTAYMLVNNAGDLQRINTAISLPNAYALGRDIDASSMDPFRPVGSAAIPFNTILDGQGHTIANLSIDATAKDVGLFAVIGSAGQVRNLNLTDVHVTASGSAFVGTLAGENRGLISDVHVLRSTVIAQSELGVTAGGLVGVSSGFIRESSSAATVHVGDFDPGAVNIAGGLSGANHGDITSSSTTGEISGGAFSLAGGMVGQNFGRLEGSFAAGGVTGGASTMAGGLVGMNASGATIRNAYAVGNVTGGSSAIAGGLVGSNAAGSLIENSYATGFITAGTAASAGGLVGQNLGDVSNAYAAGAVTVGDLGWGGGLIGRNTGTISGATVPGVTAICGAGQTCASGVVSVGVNGTAGGLAAFNSGSITSAFATGDVSGAAGVGGITTLGGLVGSNQGEAGAGSAQISNSFARGNVGDLKIANLQAGGFVGSNAGIIQSSVALGIVQAGDRSVVGGLVASNRQTVTGSSAAGDVSGGALSLAGGLVGENFGTITGHDVPNLTQLCGAGQACAKGAVNVGADGTAGGLAAVNTGSISNAFATGNVTGAAGAGATTTLGGLVGSNLGGTDANPGQIANSLARGNVGGLNISNLQAGGLVGSNTGSIQSSIALGNVQAGDRSTAGGLVASNQATVTSSSATGDVRGGALSLVGGLAGQNFGTITGPAVPNLTQLCAAGQACASGGVSVGVNGTAGGLAAVNRGTITNAFATGNVTGAAGVGGITNLGGLVGSNQGRTDAGQTQISNSLARGNVGDLNIANLQAGGLVGSNTGSIQSSIALGNVQAGGHSTVGGLVASNQAMVTSSSATGDVLGGALSLVGGLAGENFGTITGPAVPNLTQLCAAGQACASGAVSVGANGTAGGLAGVNSGTITNAFATGNVTGTAGVGGISTLGGLVGSNQGEGKIATSSARGDVGGLNIANLQAGGLVGSNAGTIQSSVALGNVQTGGGSTAGGFVASNTAGDPNCAGCPNETALIVGSSARGNVTVGAASVGGGFAGTTDGMILSSSAIGTVTGGGNSVLGGFVGTLGFGNGPGEVTDSSAAGAVTSTGPNSTAGGFVGLSGGTISSSTSSGAVTGTSESYLGGFVGLNLGAVAQSIASGPVTGVGTRDVIGGFVGANFGSIDASAATGNAIGGTDSAVGAFAGANATFVNFPSETVPGSSFPVGTITNSLATGTATGGAGSTVDPFIALVDPTTAANPPAFPSTIAGCADPTCVFVLTGLLPSSATSPLTPLIPPLPPTAPSATSGPSTSSPLLFIPPDLLTSLAAQQAQIILNLTANIQLAALSTPPVVSNVPGAIRTPPQPAPQPPSNAVGGGRQVLPGLPSRIVDIPPTTETRLIQDEVVVQIAANPDQLQAAVRRLGLTIIETQNLPNAGSIVVRLRITNGRTPAQAIGSLRNVGMAAIAQPNYVYALQEQAAAPAPAAQGEAEPQGDAAQYILEKLKMLDVHRMARGANVPIAVIDSEIDFTHPDLVGVVAQRFSAVGGAPEKPHPHGTGMAGAMAARQRVLGTAPAARLLAVHAFNAAKAESTTFNILKGIDWAVGQGARVINMSFAGPQDPSLQRSLKLAYDKGIVLVAAAGNAGAKSPPLFPGADPLVIAVTATDVDDKLFTGANRGKYISVAAPGVDILVPAPENAYQLTTGTSVAAAEVSGIVALLLERNPKLTPADIRRILTASARRLGTGERDDNFGAGLIDPLKALQLADPRIVTTTPPAGPIRQR